MFSKWKWLQDLATDMGYNQVELAKRLNWQTTRISELFSGKKDIPARKIDEFADFFRLDYKELKDYNDNKTVIPPATDKQSREMRAGLVHLDMLDATACCGDGVENYAEPVIGSWAMPIVDYHAFSNTAPQNVKIIKAIGDSMTPTISDGDYVFVDVSNPFVSSDGLYVLRLPNGLSIKRIQNGIKGDITIRSDNPQYDPITTLAGEVKVLGRVIYIFNGKKA